jgi:DNA replicative helicase MCM subunit Mcm2 (Cdc46/Mcm family)
MTREDFEKAKEIEKGINNSLEKVAQYKSRAERFNSYIDWMDGRHKPVEFAGKIYKKVDVKFNMDARPVLSHAEDMFDLVEENKKDFLVFLKKCQSNYLKMVKEEEENIKKMNVVFSNLGNEEKVKTA